MENFKQYFLLFLSSASFVTAKNFDGVGETLDAFVVEMTDDKEDQEAFKCYYSEYLERLSKTSSKSKEKKLTKLRKHALRQLKEENQSLYKEIASTEKVLDMHQPEGKEVRKFLTRYALFKDYEYFKNQDRTSTLGKITGNVQYAYGKTKNFFSRTKKKIFG